MRHGNLARDAARHDASGKLIDKSNEAAKKLARKGFRVYLESERSDKFKASTPDGKIGKFAMDVKTIGKTGKYTIKSTLEKASKQGSRTVVLMQGDKKDDTSIRGKPAGVVPADVTPKGEGQDGVCDSGWDKRERTPP